MSGAGGTAGPSRGPLDGAAPPGPSPAARAREAARGVLFGRWPRLGLAVRAAAAATLAWQIALWLPFAPAEEYPYYAPLGAVVGSYTTVRASWRNSLAAVAGIVAGALLALGVSSWLGQGLPQVALVVGVGTLVAGWRGFGEQRSWVVTAALFVLVIGAPDPVDYVLAYSGLALLGGLVAVGVNAAFPEVPLATSDRALRELSTAVADQLDDLAEGLRRDDPPTGEEWAQRLRAIEPVRESVRVSSRETEESLVGNVRARWNTEKVQRQHLAGVVLDNLATRAEELTELLVEVQSPGDGSVALDRVLRLPTADALAALAAGVRHVPEHPRLDAATTDGLREHLQRLSAAVMSAEFTHDRDRQTAGAVATLLRRCLGALHVSTDDPDPEAVLPTPWARPDPEPVVRVVRRRPLARVRGRLRRGRRS
ncbi:FUSC family protein [Kineococcus terrestris]|uniref:FUSC family protein n=1 Tax=Kineococcus terrestris TaxID=2044856 RepID=UPI0034DB282E